MSDDGVFYIVAKIIACSIGVAGILIGIVVVLAVLGWIA